MQAKNSEVCYSEESDKYNRSENMQHTPNNKGNPLHKSTITNPKSKLPIELSTDATHKLPINLFHSTAEYSKMIITNGKSIKKPS